MKGRNSVWMAILYVVIGGIVGSLLGHFLSALWSPLGHDYFDLGSPTGPWTLNLGVFGISLGIWLQLNLGGIIGVIGGLWWYRRGRV